ncbi:MAG: hypothetical protein ABGX07_20185 [Pirellulaceae bacterium]|nr:hypothetical protein [Planctomycetaceae bacterium]HIM30704.1 hypothetical protein [Planctomycetota bacterium]
MSTTIRIRITCTSCDRARGEDLEGLLRAAGHLRRQAKPDVDLMWELLTSVTPTLACDECGATVTVEQDVWEDEGEGWLEAKRCQRCREIIPVERVELFPDEVLCAVCRGAVDAGDQDDVSYCSRCGSPTELRPRMTSGITRYVEFCTACGR